MPINDAATIRPASADPIPAHVIQAANAPTKTLMPANPNIMAMTSLITPREAVFAAFAGANRASKSSAFTRRATPVTTSVRS